MVLCKRGNFLIVTIISEFIFLAWINLFLCQEKDQNNIFCWKLIWKYNVKCRLILWRHISSKDKLGLMPVNSTINLVIRLSHVFWESPGCPISLSQTRLKKGCLRTNSSSWKWRSLPTQKEMMEIYFPNVKHKSL